MKTLIFLLLIMSSAYGETILSQIDSIDMGKQGEPHLVLLKEGRVAFVPFHKKKVLARLNKNAIIEFQLNHKSELTGFREIEVATPSDGFHTFESEDPYTPSVVTLKTAGSIFTKMRRGWTAKGQCFNRAHIWTYEEFKRTGTKLNKVFMFFTSRYIRKYKYKWWFHVTPMVYVGGLKQTNWKMLDRRYTKGPIRSKTWSDIFIKTKKACKVVNVYSHYRENQSTQDCYFFPVSMYYVVPSDLARLENTGEERTEYDPIDVEHALWDGFGKM